MWSVSQRPAYIFPVTKNPSNMKTASTKMALLLILLLAASCKLAPLSLYMYCIYMHNCNQGYYNIYFYSTCPCLHAGLSSSTRRELAGAEAGILEIKISCQTDEDCVWKCLGNPDAQCINGDYCECSPSVVAEELHPLQSLDATKPWLYVLHSHHNQIIYIHTHTYKILIVIINYVLSCICIYMLIMFILIESFYWWMHLIWMLESLYNLIVKKKYYVPNYIYIGFNKP